MVKAEQMEEMAATVEVEKVVALMEEKAGMVVAKVGAETEVAKVGAALEAEDREEEKEDVVERVGEEDCWVEVVVVVAWVELAGSFVLHTHEFFLPYLLHKRFQFFPTA